MKLPTKDTFLDLSYPQVMGILNVTPDSFSDGSQHNMLSKALSHANAMINSGASIIDIGGESTRPGAAEVSVIEELDRVILVVEAIAQRFEIVISVDTSKTEVMRESASAGAHIINDVRALQAPGALEVIAKNRLSVCLMHMQGNPKCMQINPHYDNLMAEIDIFFAEQIARCTAAGIKREQLILDPGFGFGKNLSHNYQLLAHLSRLHHFGLPLLVGMSRKSMIGQLLNVGPTQRLIGSIACAVIAMMQGAKIVRVHDVKETVEAMRIVEAAHSSKE